MSEPTISPDPTDEEAAAIVAALSAAWPQAAPPVADAADGNDLRWRFSGRWWNRSTPAPRRRRPW